MMDAQVDTEYNIFLDDFRHPYDAFNIWKDSMFLKLKWEIVRTHDEFVKTITENLANGRWPNMISYDHDLDPEHYDIGEKSNFDEFDYSLTDIPTGYHTAKWLIEFCKANNLHLPSFTVHSQNKIGRKNIMDVLTEYSFSNG